MKVERGLKLEFGFEIHNKVKKQNLTTLVLNPTLQLCLYRAILSSHSKGWEKSVFFFILEVTVGNKTLFLKSVGCENIEQAQNNNLYGKPFLLEGKTHETNSE